MGRSRTDATASLIPYSILALGIALIAISLLRILAAAIGLQSFSLINLAGLATSLPVSLFLMIGGYWLPRSEIPHTRYRRMAGWCLAGLSFFVSFTGIVGISVSESVLTLLGTVQWGVAIGAGSGFLVGIFEARAIENAVTAQRVRAQELDHRRELLDYLNGILRHEILNTTQVISGYAGLLDEMHENDPQAREYARYVYREADELASVTQDVGRLLETAETDTDLEPQNLSRILLEEVRKLRVHHEEVDVHTNVPDGVFVRADSLLRRVFSNLLENAVEHNANDTPRVEVSVTVSSDTIAVRIRDDGPGVPEGMRDDLFELATRKDTTHGIGLSIVGLLVDRYEGEVALTETGPEGSAFTVELPRATTRTDEPRIMRGLRATEDREPTTTEGISSQTS